MKKRILFVLMIAALTLSACASKAATSDQYLSYSNAPGAGGVAPEPVVQEAMSPSADMSRNTVKTDASYAQLQERLVIQNADLAIVVTDPQIKMAAIGAMAKELGGFVVSSNIYQSYLSNGKTVPEGSISIRVPAEKLDSALNQIKADAVEVRNENRSGQDVTQDYIDLNSQLRSMEAAADQLTKIMQSAEKTEDVLNVFSQLQSYNQQIEVIKGQIQYYEQASALSAISITLIAEETIQPIEIGGWKPQGVARDAIQSLIRFWQGFVDFMINFFLLALPVFLTILLPIYLVFLLFRAIVRRLRGKKTPKAAE
jgi:outer membrane lipoprotein SlyB